MTAPKGEQALPDRGQGDVDAMRGRWALAAGVVAWLVTIIGPAISFDVQLALGSESGQQFEAFFLVLTTVLFLLAWRRLDRLPVWVLGALVACSLASFVGYTLAKSRWTCAYYPNIYEERFTMGSTMKKPIRDFLVENPPLEPTCEGVMENWKGDSVQIWEYDGIVRRFLILFGLYALAWLTLALLILGALRRSLIAGPPAR